MIAAGNANFQKILEANNPAIRLSKHWGFQQAWFLLKTILFWQGDTSECNTKALVDTAQTNWECHEMVSYNMSSKDVRSSDTNMVNGSWSVHKREVSCMEVTLVILYRAPRYNNVLGIGENAMEPVMF